MMTFLEWCGRQGGRGGCPEGQLVYRFAVAFAMNDHKPKRPRARRNLDEYLELIRRWAGAHGHEPETVRRAWDAWRRESAN